MKKASLILSGLLLLGSGSNLLGDETHKVESPAAADAATPPAESQGLLPVPDYSGDIWTRRYLTGDWGGTRQEWANHGAQIDVIWTQAVQSVVSGGDKTGTRYGGSLDYVLNLDLMRANILPGALVKFRAESRYGEAVNDIAGPLLPVNTDAFFPFAAEMDDGIPFTITELNYTQFFSEQFGVTLGKFQTLDGDPNEFSGGRGATQFMNGHFVFAPTGALAIPYSTVGGGIVVMPTKEIFISSLVFTTVDSSNSSGFENIGDGWTWATEVQWQYRIADLPGGMNLGFVYAFDSDFFQIGSGRFVFDRGQGIRVATTTEDDTWMLYWSGWQYVYVEDPSDALIATGDGRPDHEGVGLFARVAVADKDTNPIELYVSVGVGGRGIIPGRDNDVFGLGFYYDKVESTRLTGILGVDESSFGFEMFYNLAITPACQLTFDLQVVDAATAGADTAVILGGRLNVRF